MNLEKQNYLRKQLITTAHSFRLGREAEGSENLLICINEIERQHHQILQPEFKYLLHSMLKAQENHDWLSLADYLEYELPPLLK